MGLELVESQNDLAEFLDFLYADQSGYVYCPTKKVDEFTQYFFQWPEQAAEIQQHINDKSKTHDVYIAPALFSKPNSKKENVKGTHVLWTEFDGTIPQKLTCPSPSWRVRSSDPTHEHWYWRLEEFTTDIERVENINRGLAYTLNADTSGWDADQVLRPPLTYNHRRNLPVVLSEQTPYRTTLSAFQGLSVALSPTTAYSQTDLLDTADIIALYQWTKEDFHFYRQREIPVGDRSTAMMRLGFICAEIGMSDREIFSVLHSADERWGKFRGREDRYARLNDIVAKARLKHPSKNNNSYDEHSVYGFNSFLNTEVNISWIIEGFLESDGYFLMTGPSGVGKTQLSLRFAMNFALGLDFLGYQIREPTKSIFLSLEMGHADLKYFLSTMAKTLTLEQLALLEENLLLVPIGEPVSLTTPEGQKYVESLIDKHEPKGIFIDSMGSTTNDELTDESTVKELMAWTDKLRRRKNKFIWYIHHNRKATAQNKKPNKLDDVYGSRYITARASSVFCVWPNDLTKGVIEVIPLKVRLSATPPPFLINRTSDLNFYTKTFDPGLPVEPEITYTPKVDIDIPEQTSPKKHSPGLDF